MVGGRVGSEVVGSVVVGARLGAGVGSVVVVGAMQLIKVAPAVYADTGQKHPVKAPPPMLVGS